MIDLPFSEVRAHGRVIRYRRLGNGPVLLLLGSPADAERLARHFRVIVPELPAPADLAAFLDGLGAQGVTVVAGGRYHAAAVELARDDPDRVARVAGAAGELLGGG